MRPEGRALAVAELLRQGWTGAEVSAGLKVTDAGGSPMEAIEAMRAKRREPSFEEMGDELERLSAGDKKETERNG